MTDDIVLNNLKDHADLARHVEQAGWKLQIGNGGPEVAPNLFQDAVNKIQAQQAEIERLRSAVAAWETWAQHSDWCPMYADKDSPCECGLDDLKEARRG